MMNRAWISIPLLVLVLGLSAPRLLYGGPSPEPVEKWLSELKARVPGAAPQAGVPSEPAPSGQGEAEARKTETGPERISVDFYKIDLHNVFRLLGRLSGKNIVVDEGVSGTLTLSLKDVPWTFVLDVIKTIKNLDTVERYNTIMIFPKGKKIEWAEGAPLSEQGTLVKTELEVEEGAPPPARGPELVVKKASRIRTPLEDIRKAEALAEEAERLLKEGSAIEAYKRLREASDLWPESAELAKRVAKAALSKAGEELTGLNYAKRALAAAPGDQEAATLAAVASARMGKFREARAYFETALSGPAPTYDTLYNYAVFAYSVKDYRETIRLVNQIEDTWPITPEAMLLKAKAYEALGNTRMAIEEYTAVVHAGAGVRPGMKEYALQRIEALKEGADEDR